MTIEQSTLAHRIMAYRTIHGLSQDAFAQRIGVARVSLQRMEKGIGYPHRGTMVLIERELRLPEGHLESPRNFVVSEDKILELSDKARAELFLIDEIYGWLSRFNKFGKTNNLEAGDNAESIDNVMTLRRILGYQDDQPLEDLASRLAHSGMFTIFTTYENFREPQLYLNQKGIPVLIVHRMLPYVEVVRFLVSSLLKWWLGKGVEAKANFDILVDSFIIPPETYNQLRLEWRGHRESFFTEELLCRFFLSPLSVERLLGIKVDEWVSKPILDGAKSNHPYFTYNYRKLLLQGIQELEASELMDKSIGGYILSNIV